MTAEISDLFVKNMVSRVHPRYFAMNPQWDFMEQTYLGGRDWFDSNIFRYFKEGDEEFKARQERAYRFNHTREVVDLINKYLFRAKPHRRFDDAPPSVQRFWKDVDGSGIEMDDFARQVSQQASIFGCPWVVVDNHQRMVSENGSKADEVESGCYAYIVTPQNVMDLSRYKDGRLRWILIREIMRDDIDPFESIGQVYARFRLWTENEWYLFEPTRSKRYNPENRYTFTDSGTHGLGIVPAIRADNIISHDPWSSPSLINDIAYLDRAVANYLSNLDAVIQDQTFSQLAMPAQNLLPGDDAYKKTLEMGTKRVFLYDGEGGAQPAYLSPDPRQAQLIISAIQQIINEIYHSVGLAGERTKADNAKGIDNSSGVAKARDFERVNALLVSKADSMERFENRLAMIVARWYGEDTQIDEELVEYPETFDVRGLYGEFDIAMQLSLIEAPALMRTEQMKQVMEKLFPTLSKDLRKQIEAEIKDWHDNLQMKNSIRMTDNGPTPHIIARDPNQQPQPGPQGKNASIQNQVLSEAKRNRSAAGSKQSATKTRQANGDQTGQANGQ